MLAPNMMNYLALAGFGLLLVLLVSSPVGQAKREKNKHKQQQHHHHQQQQQQQGDRVSMLPEIDQQFKGLLDSVIDDGDLTKSLAQYMEIAPSSHKSRSAMTDLVEFMLPHIMGNGTDGGEKPAGENKNSTQKFQPRPKRRSNPMKKLIRLMIWASNCTETDTCSDRICLLINSAPDLRKKRNKKNRSNKGKEACPVCSGDKPKPIECPPCPVPDFCPMLCPYACPPEPKCPCGEKPTSEYIPKANSTTKSPEDYDEYHRVGDRSFQTLFKERPPCLIIGGCTTMKPASSSSTTTTRRTSPISPTHASISTSTTSAPTTSTTHRPSSASTTTTTTNRPSSTKRMHLSTTTSTLAPVSSSKQPNSSSSTTAMPASSTSTVKPKTNSSTLKSSSHSIVEDKSHTFISSHTIKVNGTESHIRSKNTLANHLEFMQLESGLKILLKNKTIINMVIESINSMPLRAGGLEGELAHKILGDFGEDTHNWIVPQKNARAMTYGTARRNMVHILRNIIIMIIKRNCKQCVKQCQSRLSESKPVHQCNAPKSESVEAAYAKHNTQAAAPKTCKPCWVNPSCPSNPGCFKYTCAFDEHFCFEDLSTHHTSTTTTTEKPLPTRGTGTTRPPSWTTTKSPGETSRTPTTMAPKRPIGATFPIDPDFAPDEPAHGTARFQSMDRERLDDIDMENQLNEEDRFREFPCNGSICADQKTCGMATLNDLTPKNNQSGYIINGERQKYGEWPSYARLEIMLPSHEVSLCGGVLIGKRHVLTAGHCVRTPKRRTDDPDDPELMLKAEMIQVVLGEHQRGHKDEFETRHKVAKICFSSKLNDPRGEGSRFDFAVLTLKDEVGLNDHVQPACLPYKPFPLGKSKCFVVGQGKMRDGETEFLITSKYVQKMPVARKLCNGWGFNEHDRSRWCFTKYKGQGDTCNGDSGGPILCRNRDNKWHVMGLVSYGSEACDGAESPGWVAVYSRIPALLEQIHIDCLNDS